MPDHFHVIIIGGGHAGAEAAWAAARILNAPVALITMDANAIGRMSCNPAIGGLAKGQMVREIDALGGLMARAIDAAGIQFRMLNRSKGPAVQSPRAQADKYRYAQKVQQLLRENCPTLTIIEGIVETFLTQPTNAGAPHGNAVQVRQMTGVVLQSGRTLHTNAVVLTTGTFLRALMHTGEHKTEGGRVGEKSAVGLSANLRSLGFDLGRLKTGTPPRLAKESIDFSNLQIQRGDDPPTPFSELSLPPLTQSSVLSPQSWQPPLPQLPMHITHTNAKVHDLIRANLHRAPMYSGQILSRGPRYCPSLEDKVVRFADRSAHQVFLEPEGLDTNEIYCNGISTSLPADVQEPLVHAIAGLEHAKILRLGYAVEYDFSPTHQIDASLQTRLIAGLYFAGQLNGTSGYEEAAGQGLLAGINAARSVQQKPPLILRRDQAYIGVMIDDLITKTPTEPYRMFTSRAEFRLTLRTDNADQRLTPIAHDIGLAEPERLQRLTEKRNAINALTTYLETTRLRTQHNGISAYDLLRRPETTIEHLQAQLAAHSALSPQSSALIWSLVDTEAKYAGYIDRERTAARRMHELEDKSIPHTFNFARITEMRTEAKLALQQFRPATLGQASRLEGITPSDLTILMVHLRR